MEETLIMDRTEASFYALQEIPNITNIDKLKEFSNRAVVSKVIIDFKLNVDVIVKKGHNSEKDDLIEEVEFIPKLSPIRKLLEKYDLSYVIIEKGKVYFKRTKYYRPLVSSQLH